MVSAQGRRPRALLPAEADGRGCAREANCSCPVWLRRKPELREVNLPVRAGAPDRAPVLRG